MVTHFWSSSSPLDIWFLLGHSLHSPYAVFWVHKSLLCLCLCADCMTLLLLESNSWHTNIHCPFRSLLPVSQVHACQFFVWSLCQSRQTKEISLILWHWSKMLKIRSLLWPPIHTHTHIHTNAHYCTTFLKIRPLIEYLTRASDPILRHVNWCVKLR